MVCHVCEAWAAQTTRQLEARLRNMKRAPDVEIHPCTKCGGTDWATTEFYIDPDNMPRPVFRSGWLFSPWYVEVGIYLVVAVAVFSAVYASLKR